MNGKQTDEYILRRDEVVKELEREVAELKAKLDSFKVVGYTDECYFPICRADEVYIVDEGGFDGCDVALYRRV